MQTTVSRFQHVVFADALNLSTTTHRPVDFAPAIARVAARLASPGPDAPTLQPDEKLFLNWLMGRNGIDANQYRADTLARRLPSCLRVLRTRTAAAARAAVQRNPLLHDSAISAMLIGVTSFFRDEHVFVALRDVVLPRLFEQRGRALRIWSVGCSDGAELYSVAMLLAELGALNECELLGTDCRADAIHSATRGLFAAGSILRDIPPMLARRYAPCGRVSRDIRERTSWRTTNVLRGAETGPWDVVLCRNLAIYMTASAVARLWDLLYDELRPGAFLVVGKSERPTSSRGRFEPIAPCIFQRAE